MNVTVTGATGFLGSRVVDKLLGAGHNVQALARFLGARLPPAVRLSNWSAGEKFPAEALASADAVIHLAGEPVAQRWTADAKARIYDSRIEGTRRLLEGLTLQARRPKVLVCASAVGIYGSRGDETLTENSPPGGPDFLTRLVIDWEKAAQMAEGLGIRVVRLRLGMVLGPGGALRKMLPPFRLGLGGRVGSGRQWVPWIHIEDAVNLILFAMRYASLAGPVNATAPHPVTNAEFALELAATLHRPAALPVPAFALKVLFGEMAEVLLASQRVIPKAAVTGGFRFAHPELGPALRNILAARA